MFDLMRKSETCHALKSPLCRESGSRCLIHCKRGSRHHVTAVEFGVADCVARRVRLAIPEATASISPQRASWSLSDLIQSLCALMLSEALEEAIWLPLRSLLAISSKGE
jgi:hypothetical protein